MTHKKGSHESHLSENVTRSSSASGVSYPNIPASVEHVEQEKWEIQNETSLVDPTGESFKSSSRLQAVSLTKAINASIERAVKQQKEAFTNLREAHIIQKTIDDQTIEQLRKELGESGASHANTVPGQMALSVQAARRGRVCRICRKPDKPAPGDPFVFNHGKEYAHQSCLNQSRDKNV